MNNWYLSNHGDVSGPFPLPEAQAFLKKENNKTAQFYAWHANFIQWQPAYTLAEFESIVEPPLENVPATELLHEKFTKKQQLLGERLEHVEGRVLQARDNLLSFEDDIVAYKGLTEGFSDEIKNAIVAVEKKYRSITKKLEGIEAATEIAKNEISSVREEFHAKEEATEVNTADKAVKESVVNTPQKEVKKAIEKASASANTTIDDVKAQDNSVNKQPVNVIQKAVNNKPAEAKVEKAKTVGTAVKTDGSNAAGLKGVKNIFKSVFKEPAPAPKLSEALNNPAKETPINQAEEELEVVMVDESIEDDDTPKKRRRRRRR